jgi:hypothetical protein
MHAGLRHRLVEYSDVLGVHRDAVDNQGMR